jgi:hypothetical protein
MSVRPVPDLPDTLGILPAVEVTIGALGCPPADAAVVALARTVAVTIDEMDDDQRAVMLGQTAPLLLKLLQELDTRAQRRRPQPGAGRANKVAQLRTAHAQAMKNRA